ncbi:MAG: hypothetical protein ATN35_06515 [Epulopiscium sp. Nele67-Bin004]|nr:MAG: hypothetical protein ATN35_06515 [Epulopiscium sp. Nele67-Bin004]
MKNIKSILGSLAVFFIISAIAISIIQWIYPQIVYKSDIYISQNKGNTPIKYAVNVDTTLYPTDENNFYNIKISEDTNLEEVFVGVSEFVEEIYIEVESHDIIEQIRQYLHDVTIYISEKNTNIVYNLDTSEQHPKFEINTTADIDKLIEFQDKVLGTDTKIFIDDNLAKNLPDNTQEVFDEDEVQESLDIIMSLYYNMATNMQNVYWINQYVDIPNSTYQIAFAYEALLSRNWIATNLVGVQNGETYILSNDEMTYVVSDKLDIVVQEQAKMMDIEYVYYHLNDESIGVVYGYPYNLTIDVDDILDHNNELRVSIKWINEPTAQVQNLYFSKEGNYEVGEKAQRYHVYYPIDSQHIYEKDYIPVLMYHEFADVVGQTKAEQSIAVETKLFEEQLVHLLDNGYTPINFLNLWEYLNGTGGMPEKPFIITADDGYLSNYETAYPILKKYGAQATFFIVSKYVGELETGLPHFDWEQSLEMEQSGLIDIQLHSHDHPSMDQQSKASAIYQATYCLELIEKNLGARDVIVFSYPQFEHNKNTISWLQEAGVDMQITNLNSGKSTTTSTDVKRIHVSNNTTPEDLLNEIEKLTKN